MEKLRVGFNGASLKVERAYRHLDELKSTIDGLGGGPAKCLTITDEADSGYTVGFADLGGAARLIPCMIGDCVHNLRAAYDHLWTALAREKGRDTGDFKFPTFPFHKTRENVENALRENPIALAFPELERLILDRVKPHRDAGGNEALWTITKFDKIDKHNLLIPTVRVMQIERLAIRTGGSTINLTNCSLSNSARLGSFAGPVEYEGDGKITFEITFPKGDFLPGEPVIPSLLNMAQSTQEVVELFREIFLPS